MSVLHVVIKWSLLLNNYFYCSYWQQPLSDLLPVPKKMYNFAPLLHVLSIQVMDFYS